MNDLISRQAAIDAIEHRLAEPAYQHTGEDWYVGMNCAESELYFLPSAQPAQRWIPIESRPMDEDERREWSERLGFDIEYEDALIYTSQLPDDGQEVIVCTKYGRVYVDTFCNDEGCYFEDNGDMDGIVAWMPKPEPYKPKEEP